jgi:acetate---CoA ligase (ADP-forming) subunit beta
VSAGVPPSMIAEPEAIAWLQRYGIAYPGCKLAASAGDAAQTAGELGYPVVLKIVSPEIVHKSDVGGVEVGLASAEEVVAGYGRIMDAVRQNRPEAAADGVLVCKQAPPGVEVIVGGLVDPMFGRALMFGMGGIFAEILNDVTFRVIPITPADAGNMIREVRGYPLLAGARNRPACDREALADLLVRVSRLMEGSPEIEELDLNPVRVYAQGVLVLDVKMMRGRA